MSTRRTCEPASDPTRYLPNTHYARDAARYRAYRAHPTRHGTSARRTPVFAPRRRIPRGKVAALIVCIALVAAASFCATRLPVPFGGGSSDASTSTPVDQWEKGWMPYLYQTDPAWADEPYAGGTVRENGCGPTCLSMVYIDLTGNRDLDPAKMALLSEHEGHVDSGMTSWTLMTEGAAALGLSSREISANASAVVSELSQGNPVICSVGPGDFTTTGHFIVLSGVDESGQVIVHDPNSAERSERTWDIDRVLSQCLNLWAFSAA